MLFVFFLVAGCRSVAEEELIKKESKAGKEREACVQGRHA
jgi:hypothetical protein